MKERLRHSASVPPNPLSRFPRERRGRAVKSDTEVRTSTTRVVVPRRQECRRYGRASGGAGGEKRNRSHNIHNQSATADLFGDEGPLGVVVPRRQECRRYGRASAGGAVKSDTKFRTSTTSPRRRTCLATRDRSGRLCHVGRSAGATAGLRGRSWMVNVVLWGGVFRAWESLCHTGKVPALRRVGTFTTTNGCATTA
jgi:hypothetical protein